ncbi:MAG: ATP-dependent RecD-like DNA helicase [Oscillospiraceae bacterium]|nr:ATP-dependent RecD-like DNA helicase [Oscillospiraceae bacterium]
MGNSAIINGTVQAVVFRNEDNGYCVLRLRTLDRVVTAVGTIPDVTPGETLTMEGEWQSHPSYGDQFKADAVERTMPNTADNIYEYLSSGAIKGVGAKTAQLIVRRFGARALEVIEETPEKLAEISGITERKAAQISAEFMRKQALRSLMDFLVKNGVRPVAAARLYKVYGEDAKAAVAENPYILCDEYFGMDFFEADALALHLGFEGDSPERVEAACLYELRHNQLNGHVFIPRDKLALASSQLIGVDPELAKNAIADLEDGGYIISESVAGVDACYPDDMYENERFVAENLLERANMKLFPPKNLDKLVIEAERNCSVEFAPVQREAVRKSAECGVMVLTGGPGTGKTTTVRGILELFDSMGLETMLTAPTGRAAKRLSELTGRDAQTVHRLLGAGAPDAETGKVFKKDASDPLDCDAVILDETSMMDISLMAALLEAMKGRARLILVGDADQLPSVGPGNVFADIIRSGAIETVRLNEIFRQAESSSIVKNAHLINSGTVPELRNGGGDFFFLRRGSDDEVRDTVVSLISQRLPENMGIRAEDIQILSPSRKTSAGTGEINAAAQALLNPPSEEKPEKVSGGKVFRAGDRVMQTRNNYDIVWYKYHADPEEQPEVGAGIFNGDVGYIESIEEKRGYAVIRFEDKLTPYPFDSLEDLELAYAVTVHKSQGSEYRAVILALPQGVPMLKTRGVLYTAVTRARELLIVVGSGESFAEMVHNDRRQRRYSGLRARLAGETGNA